MAPIDLPHRFPKKILGIGRPSKHLFTVTLRCFDYLYFCLRTPAVEKKSNIFWGGGDFIFASNEIAWGDFSSVSGNCDGVSNKPNADGMGKRVGRFWELSDWNILFLLCFYIVMTRFFILFKSLWWRMQSLAYLSWKNFFFSSSGPQCPFLISWNFLSIDWPYKILMGSCLPFKKSFGTVSLFSSRTFSFQLSGNNKFHTWIRI